MNLQNNTHSSESFPKEKRKLLSSFSDSNSNIKDTAKKPHPGIHHKHIPNPLTKCQSIPEVLISQERRLSDLFGRTRLKTETRTKKTNTDADKIH